MNKYKIVFLSYSVLMVVGVYANNLSQPSVITGVKQGKLVECVGVRKVITTKKASIHKGNKIELSFNESGNLFEAIEQDTSDLGGYSPIPYPCNFIDGFTSKDLNISNEKVFMCKDESYATTEEVYLLKNCMIKGR